MDRDRFTASCHLPSILRVSGFAVIQPAIVPKKIELPDNCKTVGNQSDDWRGVSVLYWFRCFSVSPMSRASQINRIPRILASRIPSIPVPDR